MTALEATGTAARPKVSPLKALGLLAAAILLVAGYLVLCSVMGNPEYYAGFLFLLCWTALEHGKVGKLPPVILGAACGLALGYAMQRLMGGPLGAAEGGYIFGAIVLPIIYCQLMGWLSHFVNFTTMTFLAVVTIPHIQRHADFRNTAVALVVGIVYFGLILGVTGRVSERRNAAFTES
jgi:hypothetical protein